MYKTFPFFIIQKYTKGIFFFCIENILQLGAEVSGKGLFFGRIRDDLAADMGAVRRLWCPGAGDHGLQGLRTGIYIAVNDQIGIGRNRRCFLLCPAQALHASFTHICSSAEQSGL